MSLVSSYRDWPVKRKLHLIVIATVGLALVVSSCAALTYMYSVMRQSVRNDLVILAEMYGANSTAALAFDDRTAAQELLSGFRAKTSILSAVLFRSDGIPLAAYQCAKPDDPPPLPLDRNSTRIADGRIQVIRRILLDGQPIGAIYLESSLEDVNRQLKRSSLVLLGILIAAFFASFTFAARLQNAISEPIRSLAEVARQVRAAKDYSQRAKKLSNDDLGQLTAAFNEMLTEIEERDRQLLANQDRLEQKVVERTSELAQATHRLSLALDGANETLWDWDIVNKKSYLSERWAEALGYLKDEFSGAPEQWVRFIHEDDRIRSSEALRDYIRGLTEHYEAEFRIRTKPGGWRWIQARGKVAERTSDGTPTRVTGTLLDITERKEAEQALARQHYILDTLIESVPDHIYFKDLDSRFIRANRAMVQLFGLHDPAEMVGKCDSDFFAGAHASEALTDECDLIEGRVSVISKEEKETWPDGHETWVQTTKLPLRDHSGEVIGTFGISRDITERKRMEEALRAAKETAEAASRSKSEFLANMSHEIRTPMNGIIGMTELAFDTDLTEQQRDYLKTVRSSANSLLTIINDILDFSKIEAGKLVLDRCEFNLDELLEDTVRTVAVSAHQKSIELLYENHLAPDTVVVGDPGRIRQVVINLLGNAVKFTSAGEVRLEVRALSRHSPGIELHFTVSDTGIGISAEWQERIFEAFVQADASNTRRYGGTGLGLAICSRLVSLMGGRIWMESQPGRGSSFHFTAALGLASAAASPPPMAELTSLRGLRVLVVDDNETNRRILRDTLLHWQMDPELASSGAEALEILDRPGKALGHFDLVLLYAQMPGMDGFTLARRISSRQDDAGPRIMMLSSVDVKIVGTVLPEIGIANYLVKPVTRAALLKVILRVMASTGAEPAAAPVPAASSHFQPLHVLLAEDNPVNQRIAMLLLQRDGHSVAIVENGAEAVEALERDVFDLVLMDVQMPVMNGYQASREIRKRETRSGRRTPIVALTAHAMKGDREICMEAGMDDYLSKPIQTGELRQVLARFVSVRQGECA